MDTEFEEKLMDLISEYQTKLTDDEIMSVIGNIDFASYAKYLRDLGVDVDAVAVEGKTRAF